MNELAAMFSDFGRLLLGFVSRPEVIAQAVIILGLFGASWALAWWAEPRLEAKAREIKGYPGLLRLIVVLLRRLKWIAFVLLLTSALVLVRSIDWPPSDRVLSSALLLALAWLVISIVSHVLRSRLVGRLFAVVGWIYVAAAILGITDDLALVLDNIAFEFGSNRWSLLWLLQLIAVFGILLWIAFSLGNVLDHQIQRSDELTPSLRILIGKVVRATLLGIAVLVGLSSLEIDLTVFAVFAGALGVGLGFGLQRIVSNFISGIVILLDRSIEPGDTISLGHAAGVTPMSADMFGWVKELRARFVSVVTRDGREYLIPNEEFITREVINWSYSDELVRLDVKFRVSYDSDPHEVQRLAIEAAAAVPRVVPDRSPACWLASFGEFSLEFLLRFWIRDPQNGLASVQGTVLLAIWDKLKEAGIEVPYPRREIRLASPVEVRTTP
jgi:small-conductance mechanosensitive channel